MCSIFGIGAGSLDHLTTEKTAAAALRESTLPVPSLTRERNREIVLSSSGKSQDERQQSLRRLLLRFQERAAHPRTDGARSKAVTLACVKSEPTT